jgi:hypothetical protein
MKQQFVPYEIALKLKDKGFDEECLGTYQIRSANPSYMYGKIAYYDIETNKVPKLCIEHSKIQKNSYLENEIFNGVKWGSIAAPLWQQAIDWFAEKHNIDISTPPFWSGDGRQYSTIIYLKSTGSIVSDDENTFHLFPEKDTKQEAQLMAIEHALTLI